MNYFLCCCMEENKWDTPTKSEGENVVKQTIIYCEELRKNDQSRWP